MVSLWRFTCRVVLLAVGLAGPFAVAHTENDCDLDCSASSMLQEEELAGVVYSIVDGDVIRIGAAGVANASRGDPLHADAKVHIGSVTKTLIALGVLRLVAQERVDLEASLETLLPKLRLDNPWAPHVPVTLRHLLDHTSGLDDARLWQMFSLDAHPDAPLAAAFDRDLRVLRIRSEPGTLFSYSNMGYALVGMVIESITGERYETWLDRELLEPLAMSDSTFGFVTQTGSAHDARLAWGHYDDLRPVAALPIWLRPAAQFTTTASDMARVAQFLMGDGRIDGAVFVPHELLQQMARPRTTIAAKAGLAAGYALGLATRDRHGAVGLCHTGNIVGFRAILCVYPQHQKAFFVSHNSDSENAQYSRFDALMTQALAVETPPAPAVGATLPLAWQGRYVTSPARFETFRYFEMLFDSFVLSIDEEGVSLEKTGEAPRKLVRVGRNLYRAEDRRAASHVLLSAPDGTHTLSDGTRTLRRVDGVWYALQWASFVLGIAGMVTLVVMLPWRHLRRREPLVQPAFIALLLIALPLPFFALQPLIALGDETPASLALYVATLALPFLMAGQLLWIVCNRRRIASWPVHILAAALVLQWCISLYAWDLLPLALWT